MIRNINWLFAGFEDGDYYPEKNVDHRVRRERVPVSIRFVFF